MGKSPFRSQLKLTMTRRHVYQMLAPNLEEDSNEFKSFATSLLPSASLCTPPHSR